MARTINQTQTQQLQEVRALLGEYTFQRIQLDVWKRFSPKKPPIDKEGNLAPLALWTIWDELILALRAAVKRQIEEKESSTRLTRTGGQLWELQKNGVKWSATLNFKSEHQGWEVVITRDGKPHAQQFLRRQDAEAWADKECVEIANGWK